ncbi:MAG: hypothetical protein IT374_00800 [Polyangiaceae bacterium]|nr:hypothetical protein [Polyangiaceae bacterium]
MSIVRDRARPRCQVGDPRLATRVVHAIPAMPAALARRLDQSLDIVDQVVRRAPQVVQERLQGVDVATRARRRGLGTPLATSRELPRDLLDAQLGRRALRARRRRDAGDRVVTARDRRCLGQPRLVRGLGDRARRVRRGALADRDGQGANTLPALLPVDHERQRRDDDRCSRPLFVEAVERLPQLREALGPVRCVGEGRRELAVPSVQLDQSLLEAGQRTVGAGLAGEGHRDGSIEDGH